MKSKGLRYLVIDKELKIPNVFVNYVGYDLKDSLSGEHFVILNY